MTDILTSNESKYVKQAREVGAFRVVSILFLFALFVMPQYFGIPFPLFDLTILRIMIILVSIMIFSDKKRSDEFIGLIKSSSFIYALMPYLFVIVYTMVLRADIKAFLNPFIELYSLSLMVYVISNSIGVKTTVRLIVIFSYIMTVLGVIEYMMGKTPFEYLETIKGIYTGAFVRSGNYRIMSSAVHSLGYGLLLITAVPFACYDEEKDSINLMRRPLLFALFFINIMLTGSRSTLGIFFLEAALLIAFSDKEKKKKILVFITLFAICFTLAVIIFKNTSFGQYVLLQLTSVVDAAFGTTYSVQYGADQNALGSSSAYREQLKGIFKVRWLNPILGIGRKRNFSGVVNGSVIQSIDSFYIAEYIRYAYPGMFSFMGFMGYWIYKMTKSAFVTSKSKLSYILLIGMACYALNLKWVDSLQTLKYMYVLCALSVCNVTKTIVEEKKQHSKYIKDKYMR